MPQDDVRVKWKPAMRVFVFEFMTAMGGITEESSPDYGLYREGRAMRDAVAEDFAHVAGVDVLVLPDKGTPARPSDFEQAARVADWTLVIAPEFRNTLLLLAEMVERAGSRLLGCLTDAIMLTSDKLAIADHWRTNGVQTPATTDRVPTACEAFPLVWKPRDGAGSIDTFLLTSALDVSRAKAHFAAEDPTVSMILQEFVPGQPTSVAFLCGPQGNVPLLPTFQILSKDGRFKYEGGELPIQPDCADRALPLARLAGASGVCRSRSCIGRRGRRVARLRDRDQSATHNLLCWLARAHRLQPCRGHAAIGNG